MTKVVFKLVCPILGQFFRMPLIPVIGLVISLDVANATEDKAVLIEDTYFESGYTSIGLKAEKILGLHSGYATAAGAWKVLSNLSVGIEGEVLTGKVKPKREDAEELALYQLSLFSEYEFLNYNWTAISGAAVVGWGQAGYRHQPDVASPSSTEAVTYTSDTFVAYEPRLSGLVHVSRRVDLGMSFGRRFVRGINLAGIGDADVGGVSMGLFLRGNF